MLWVLKRTVSMRWFFSASKIYAIFLWVRKYLQFYADFFYFCLSKPVMTRDSCVKVIVRGFIILLRANVKKKQHFSLSVFKIKCWFSLFRAGTHKMLVRIANTENPDQ